MKLTKSQLAVATAMYAAQAADLAKPYAALASTLATAVALKVMATEEAGAQRASLWATFKGAFTVAHDANHSADDLRAGLDVACQQAEIPTGSFRSYVGTIGNMYAELAAGTLTSEEARALSIADARARYPGKGAAHKAAIALLVAELKGWTVAEVGAMTAEVKAENEARKAEKEAEKVAATG